MALLTRMGEGRLPLRGSDHLNVARDQMSTVVYLDNSVVACASTPAHFMGGKQRFGAPHRAIKTRIPAGLANAALVKR